MARERNPQEINQPELIPQVRYRPMMKAALDRLPEIDNAGPDLLEYLFSDEELNWLRTQY